ncbi:bifunctional acetate--CoA ligase family protein/GNAT family N-acetyltransferase [Vineibacter terrae]|uniref:bifunctional acetate--CoA ligase family protein/GNAT family N-acetyltransferase n=1 Tax=Vineibacter terrae TaxID=2586908 RepID=UPI002E361F45|nr:bifunctional acetate--CoA ligase family protein/GNAT family N-acetyltransferase [Vineibacter terrae]HEX2892012.1 bifunctional acetate--CoA ligase family protein/GNAT family N-acetyltransferase [Vineibacter terrae]
MSLRHLDALLKPRSIALIGASARPGSVGALLMDKLGDGRFTGEVWPVNPKGRLDDGRTAFRDLSELPAAPDLAVIATPGRVVPGILHRLACRGGKAAIVLAGDLGDGDEARRAKAERLVARIARRRGLRVLGPASVGLQSPGIGLDASLSPTRAPTGDLAFVTQSAAVASAAVDWAAARRIGFSHAVTLGDMVDLDFGVLLDWLALDEGTRAILLHIESVKDARYFMSAARVAARAKPVIVLKTGRSLAAARAVHAQAGAIGGDNVYDAAFRRAGMLRVADLDELFEATATLAANRQPLGSRLAILANGGGLGVVAVDTLLDLGGRLAVIEAGALGRPTWAHGNPLDVTSDAPAEHYAEAARALLAAPSVDAVLAIHAPSPFVPATAPAQALIDAAASSRKPVFASWVGGTSQEAARRLFVDAGIPSHETPRQAVRGFMQLVNFRRNRETLMETPASQPETFVVDAVRARQVIAAARAEGRLELTPEEALRVLQAAAIATAPTFRPIEGTAYDLAAALRSDPVFGPVLVFGRGGRVGRRLDDRALALPPLNMALAHDVMMRTRVWRLLQGGEDQRAAALDALALTLIKVAQIAVDLPEVESLRIEPLRVDARAAVAMSARIVLMPPERTESRLAIRPYPKELESTERLADGRAFLLRPVRPEDEPLLIDMSTRMTREDVRLRFFAPLPRLSHEMAARLTQLDYDRQMALVALGADADGARHAWGVVRIAADPDNETAEFAVTVRSDMKGQGLGSLLMERITTYARDRGLKTLMGYVLSENEPMLSLSRRLGFRPTRVPDDPTVQKIVLRL